MSDAAAPPDPRQNPLLNSALARAGSELRLQSYYLDCVRPLFGMPRTQWPRCCGRGCEPCAQTLIAVAERVYELLESPESSGDVPGVGESRRDSGTG